MLQSTNFSFFLFSSLIKRCIFAAGKICSMTLNEYSTTLNKRSTALNKYSTTLNKLFKRIQDIFNPHRLQNWKT